MKVLNLVLTVVVFGLVGCAGVSDVVDSPVVVEEVGSPVVVAEVSFADTIEGLDDNSDGVWDDVAEYIFANYDDEAMRRVLMRYARMEQYFILSEGIKELADSAALATERVMACMYSMYEDEQVWDMLDDVLNVILNTRERMSAYLVANSLLDENAIWTIPEAEFAAMCE